MSVNPFINHSGELSNELLLNIAEILTLKLPESTERIIASKWVKKFLACDPKIYKHNLSLFISCLTKNILVKPFDEAPQDLSSEWKNFDREYSTKDINAAVIHRLYKDSFTPPYKFDISSDMKEYMVYQEIPFFGSHVYYAFSLRDRVDNWRGFNKMNVPKSLIEKLWKAEEIESPIKGRFFPKPQKTTVLPTSTTSKKAPRVKPAWQGPIAEEPEEVKKEVKPMVVIPMTERVKHLPPALQRRMIKADKEREEKLTLLQQEKAEREKRLDAQKAKGRFFKGSKTMKKIIRKPSVDEIKILPESKSTSVKKASPEPIATTSRSPKIPEFSGPKADAQRKLYMLRKLNPPEELVQTTRDMNAVSRDINVEATRLTREGKPNFKNVEKLHEASKEIGNQVLRMMKNQQAEEIQNGAIIGCEAISNVQLTMNELNKMLKKTVQPKEETLVKLANIKRNMAESAAIAQAVAEIQSEKIVAIDVISKINEMKKANENAQEKLENIQPENQEEKILINELISDNEELAFHLNKQSAHLADTVENNRPNIESVMKKTIITVDDILEMSFSKDDKFDEIHSEAVNIQRAKNQQLDEISKQTLEIGNQIDNIYKKAASNQLVAKYLQAQDDADENFSEVIDDEFIKKRKLKWREQANLYDITEDDENLLNISDAVMNELEKSIEIIEEFETELEQRKNQAESEEEYRIIESAVKNLQNNVGTLNEQLVALDDAISNTTLVP